jgi:predicted  nucleic acid-binding Zn-ribbon protein
MELVPVGVMQTLYDKFLRMRQKRNNKIQTLRSLRRRHEELQEDYNALKEELAEMRAAWEAMVVDYEELKNDNE